MPFDIVAARAAGATDDQIRKFLSDKIDVAGAEKAGATLDDIAKFVSKQPVKKAEQAIQPTPPPKKEPFLNYRNFPQPFTKGGREFWSKDIPEVAGQWWQGAKEAYTAPTLAEHFATNPAVREQGSLANLMANIPEKTIRGMGVMADVPLKFGELGLRGVNKIAFGLPGKAVGAYMQSPMAQGLIRTGGKLARTEGGKAAYEIGQTPGLASDIKAAGNVLAVTTGPKAAIKTGELGTQAIKATGTGIKTTGEALKSHAIPKMAGSLGETSSALHHINPMSRREASKDLWTDVTKYNLQEYMGEKWKMAEKAEELANRAVDLQKISADLSLKGGEKLNPGLIARRAAEDISDINPEYVKAYQQGIEKVMSGLNKKVSDRLGKQGYYQSLDPIELIKMKKDLGGNIFSKSTSVDVNEPLYRTIKKKMALALLEEMGKRSPATRTLGREAKKLYDIAEIADLAGMKNIKNPSVFKSILTGGGIGGAIGAIHPAMSLIEQIPKMASGAPADVTMVVPTLAAIAGGTAVGAYKAAKNPFLQYRLGDIMEKAGTAMRGEKIPKPLAPEQYFDFYGKSKGEPKIEVFASGKDLKNPGVSYKGKYFKKVKIKEK